MTDPGVIHGESFVFDCHLDTLNWLVDRQPPEHTADFNKGVKDIHVDYPRAKEGGLSAGFFSIFMVNGFSFNSPIRRGLQIIELAHRIAAQSEGNVVVATSPDELTRARDDGKLAIVISIENGCVLEGSIEVLHAFYKLGVRVIGLVWNGRNALADGMGVRSPGGLTELGLSVIKECEQLGMLVDVSHLADIGFFDLVENFSGPFMATHSNARALANHPRNLTDEQIKIIAERGGVIGLNFCPLFLNLDEEKAGLDDIVRHYMHIAELCGPDVLALGSDFDGIRAPKDVPDVASLPKVTKALMDRGVSPVDVRKFLGGNFLRLFKKVSLPRV